MKIKSIIILLILFVSFDIMSKNIKTNINKTRLAFLPKSFSAKIEQIIVSTIRKKRKVIKGQIDYKYSGYFRYEQLGSLKEQLLLITNKKTFWYYRPPFKKGWPGDLIINPTGRKFPLIRFFNSLRKGLRTNKLYSVKKFGKNLKIVFNKKLSVEMGISEALLDFKSTPYLSFENLKSIGIKKMNGKMIIFNMLSIKRDVKFQKDHFNFTPPANTNTRGR